MKGIDSMLNRRSGLELRVGKLVRGCVTEELIRALLSIQDQEMTTSVFFCVFFPFSFPLGTGNFNLFFLLNSNTDFYYFWSTQTQLQECFSTFSSHLQEGIIIIIICLLELALLRIKTGKHENFDV